MLGSGSYENHTLNKGSEWVDGSKVTKEMNVS